MTLDEALKSFPQILERLERVETQNAQMLTLLQAKGSGLERPVYDIHGLQELGYSKDQSYAILRSHGSRRGGRLRVTFDKLLEYQNAVMN